MADGPHVFSARGVLTLRAVCLAVGLAASLAAGAVCTPFVEEDATGLSASLRPDAASAGSCRVDEATYRQTVAHWLRDRPPAAAPLSSLSLGRAVHYPWISQHLANAALHSPGWAKRIAAAPAAERDRLAGFVFKDPLLLQRLAAPFEGTAYRVLGVGHEKVLFGRADVHASPASASASAAAVQVPFDAQLWLRLAPRN